MERPVSPSWESLLEAVGARGDRDAYAALFDHFAPRIASVTMRGGLDAEAAEEVAQETFVAVWRRASTFDPAKASAGAWLYAIARNKRIDRLRKDARLEPDPDDPAFAPEPPDSAETALDGRQRAERVRAAVAALPAAQRDVLTRAYFADKTHMEIAEELSAPLGTVKSRLRLALERIRAALQAEGLDEPL